MAQNTTNATTAKAATERSDGPLSGLILLGTFGSEDDPSAMLRLPGGQVETVSRGDRVNGSAVKGIEPGVVLLSRGGTLRRLTLP